MNIVEHAKAPVDLFGDPWQEKAETIEPLMAGSKEREETKPRLKPINRQQLLMKSIDVFQLKTISGRAGQLRARIAAQGTHEDPLGTLGLRAVA